MNILFVHQRFPTQFAFLAPALARRGHEVVALTLQKLEGPQADGVDVVPYGLSRISTPNIHPWLNSFESMTIRGDACFRAALKLKAEGYTPDVIVAHPGWGESMFLKEVWPDAKLGIYCEFYWRVQGADIGFDPEFPAADDSAGCQVKLKNLNNQLHFDIADVGIAPTHWQASTFPEPFRGKIAVIHDGIDTEFVKPNPGVKLTLNGDVALTKGDEIITFVNRNLEPYRGYHIFMRALPEILRRRPNAKVLIAGGDGAGNGPPPADGRQWKNIFAEEVRPLVSDQDWSRVHFLGNIPYEHFVPFLQISTVHVYLTYPFVLSWSLLEAMSAGCAIVASDTQPLREAIRHGETGRLVEFFDAAGLCDEVCSLLDDAAARASLGANARAFVKAHYDLQTVCLPRQLKWVEDMF
ncbi:glycosyltransferase family 4 protein [Duganella sp. Dugasp56]|uniref:glycosyltransferase family 4 protein n=1 Tax=Duganella sp. Dugasp56 TaxID=3243046 RepID=UPI0039AEA7A7